MKCKHCGSEWTTAVESRGASCPFCGKQLGEVAPASQPAPRGYFQLSHDNKSVVQFSGKEKNVVIPAGVTRIGSGAFWGYGVETVYIPDGVIEIGDNCFNGCEQLREVRIPVTVTKISDSAFQDTRKVKIKAEKGSYAYNKYAKQETADAPVVFNLLTETKTVKEPCLVAPAKSAEMPKKTVEQKPVAPKIEEVKTVPPVPPTQSEASLEAYIEKSLNKEQARQSREVLWAQILGCKPGEKPWRNIESKLFSSADKRASKLIAQIANISDQELLICIALETNRVDVCCAAVKKISDQTVLKKLANDKNYKIRAAAAERITDIKVLEQLALHDANASVRLIALERVTDTVVLRNVAQNDPDRSVRDAAFFRIATPAEVKKQLLCSENSNDKNKLSRISGVADLIDLALSAKNSCIRAAAAERLSAESAEAKLIKAAAALSEKIVAVEVGKFEEAYEKLKKTNPEFLRKVATLYPDTGVRYLARGREGIKVEGGGNVVEGLRMMTPSQDELRKREKIDKYYGLLCRASKEASKFIGLCRNLAMQGERHAEQICIDGWKGFQDFDEVDTLVELLKIELKKREFHHAVVSRETHYVKEWEYGKGYVEKVGGYAVKISTSW